MLETPASIKGGWQDTAMDLYPPVPSHCRGKELLQSFLLQLVKCLPRLQTCHPWAGMCCLVGLCCI